MHQQKKEQDYLLFLLAVVRVVLRLAAVFFFDFVEDFVEDFLAAAFVQDEAHSVVIPTDAANFLHA